MNEIDAELVGLTDGVGPIIGGGGVPGVGAAGATGGGAAALPDAEPPDTTPPATAPTTTFFFPDEEADCFFPDEEPDDDGLCAPAAPAAPAEPAAGVVAAGAVEEGAPDFCAPAVPVNRTAWIATAATNTPSNRRSNGMLRLLRAVYMPCDAMISVSISVS